MIKTKVLKKIERKYKTKQVTLYIPLKIICHYRSCTAMCRPVAFYLFLGIINYKG